jgi:hypothetical protein
MKKLAVIASLLLAAPAAYACPGHHDDQAQTPKTAEKDKQDPKASSDKAQPKQDAPKQDAPKADTAKAKDQPAKPGDKVSSK